MTCLQISGSCSNPPTLIDKIRKFFETLADRDIAEYIRLVSEGTIYEQIRDIANRNLQEGQSPIERKDAKILMFYMLFSGNQGQHDNPMINELKRVFSTRLYPKVAELFRIHQAEISGLRDGEAQQQIVTGLAIHRKHNHIAQVLPADLGGTETERTHIHDTRFHRNNPGISGLRVRHNDR